MSRKDTGPTATANAHKAAGNWAGKVSRALHKAGVPCRGGSDPHNGEALRVRSSEVGRCRLTADFDSKRTAEQMMEAAEDALRRAGYIVTRADSDDIIAAYVTQAAFPSADWKKRKDLMNRWTYENRKFPAWVIDVTETAFVARKGRRDEGQPFDTLVAATTYIEGQTR